MAGIPFDSRPGECFARPAAHLLAGGGRTFAHGGGASDAFTNARRCFDQPQFLLLPGDLDEYLCDAHRLLRCGSRSLWSVDSDFLLWFDADRAFAADRFHGGPLRIPGGMCFPIGDAVRRHRHPASCDAMTVRPLTAENLPDIAAIQSRSPEAAQWDPPS